ncbi:MAG: hypothetical protein ACI4DZ_00145 [Oliverpabstia sp.]
MNDSEKLDLIMERLDAIDNGMEVINNGMETINNEMKQFEVINSRLDVLEYKQGLMHKKLDNLVFDMRVSERSLKKEIKLLQDAQETLITVLEHKAILPAVK